LVVNTLFTWVLGTQRGRADSGTSARRRLGKIVLPQQPDSLTKT